MYVGFRGNGKIALGTGTEQGGIRRAAVKSKVRPRRTARRGAARRGVARRGEGGRKAGAGRGAKEEIDRVRAGGGRSRSAR